MSERRYDETEIRAIFARAAEEQDEVQRRLGSDDGLTLAELTQIGEEAGLSPAFVARAAASLDRLEPAPPPTRYFGLPVGVSRTVYLDAPLTDDEWEVLVSDLRYTFDAKGKERSTGTVREWRNSNLYAIVERSDGGHRVRFGTRKGNAKSNLILGSVFVIVALVSIASGFFFGDPKAALPSAPFGLMGGALILSTILMLPRWADRRGQQIEGIAERLLERSESRKEAVSVPLLDLEEPNELESDRVVASSRMKS